MVIHYIPNSLYIFSRYSSSSVTFSISEYRLSFSNAFISFPSLASPFLSPFFHHFLQRMKSCLTYQTPLAYKVFFFNFSISDGESPVYNSIFSKGSSYFNIFFAVSIALFRSPSYRSSCFIRSRVI